MNYKYHYDRLISTRQSMVIIKLQRDHPDYQYYENHIIPRCMRGSDESKNKMSAAAKTRDRSSQTGIYHWSKKITINGDTKNNKEWLNVFGFKTVKSYIDTILPELTEVNKLCYEGDISKWRK